MAISKLARWLSRGVRAIRTSSPVRRASLRFEGLEDRVTPAVHTWIGPAAGVWSVAANWSGGVAPPAGQTNVDLVFNTVSNSTANIANLSVNSITFSANSSVLVNTTFNLLGLGSDDDVATGNNVTATFTGADINLTGGPAQINPGSNGLVSIQNNLTGGPGGLRVAGSGTVRLAGTASYTGLTQILAGTLELNNSAIANSTLAGSTILVGDGVGAILTAELRLLSDNQIPNATPITVNADGHVNLNGQSERVGALNLSGGLVRTGVGVLTLLGNVTASDAATPSVLLGNIDLGGADRTFTVANGAAASDLVINGVISGTGGLILEGAGTLEIAGTSGSPNTYSGDTSVNSGTLLLNADGIDEAIPQDLFVGDGSVGNGLAVVRLQRDSQIANDVIDEVRVNVDGRLELNGFIDSIRDLILRGGQVTTGASGSLAIIGATIASGATPSTITGNLVLASSGTDNLVNVEGGSDLIIDGRMSGVKGLLKLGRGTLEIKNTVLVVPNTYGGETTVNEGALLLNSGALDGAIPGPLTIGDSFGGGRVQLQRSNQIANTTPITILNGLLDLNGHTETTIGLIFRGGLVTSNGGGLLRVTGDIASAAAGTTSVIEVGQLDLVGATRVFTVGSGNAGVDLQIRSSVENGGIIKNGPGRMILEGTNTYSGPTILNAGTLEINGTQTASPVTVRGGTLGGSGTIGTLTGTGTGGVIDPGPEGTGISSLSTSSVVFGTTTYAPDLTFALGLSLSDFLNVQGSVDVTGASLTPNFAGGGVFVGNKYVIIVNDGLDPVIGTFEGLAEGALFLVNETTLGITYRGGNGNDVVLTVLRPAQPLAVSGRPDGSAVVFAPGAAGQFGTPATLSPFGNLPADVRVAVGDVNGDGAPDTILVTGPGTPIRFAVVSGADNSTLLIPPTAPFAGSEGFTGGGYVAAADIDGDGRAEIVATPDQGGGPRVTIFSLVGTTPTVRANFFGIDDAAFRGGARAALGDVNRDFIPDLLVAAGFGGGPRVAIFNGATLFTTRTKLQNDFFAFPEDAATLRNGIFAALGDITGDGFADLIFGGGPGGAPRVFILSGQLFTSGNPNLFSQPVANFFVANNSSDRGGVRVAAKNADGDSKADLAIGSGEGSPANVRVYLGTNFTSGGEPSTFQDLSVFGGVALTDGVFVG